MESQISHLKKKIWIDPDLLNNKSGIGRDARSMQIWLETNFKCEIIEWPSTLKTSGPLRRKILLANRLLFGKLFHLPNTYTGILYQSQLGPLIPGSGIHQWVIRLHDLFPVTNPEWFHKLASRIFVKSLNIAINSNAIFLCDSKTTENELFRLFPNQQISSHVVPCTLPKYQTNSCGICQGCIMLVNKRDQNFYLTVGTVEPRKNYQLALEAWEIHLREVDLIDELILIGRPGWKTKKLQNQLKSATTSGIYWISDCCDGALAEFYSRTKALISFSYAEGFDLPTMEARQNYAKPLILSDIPVHREFHNGDAQFFQDKYELLEILKGDLRAPSFSMHEVKAEIELRAVLRTLG